MEKMVTYREKKIELTYLAFFLACATIFALDFVFLLYYEPIGDDITSFFMYGNFTNYIDGFRLEENTRITSLYQVYKQVKFLYINWGGRVIGYSLSSLSALIPKWGKALWGTIVQLANCLLIIRLSVKTKKQVLNYPMTFVLIFCSLFWYRPLAFFNYMWTFLAVYETSLLLCLIYIILQRDYEFESYKSKTAIQLLGFAVGMTHEIYVAITFFILGVMWLYKVIKGKKKPGSIVNYLGFFLGTIICVAAPGNYSRLNESHEQSFFDVSLYERMIHSLKAHIDILSPQNTIAKIAICVFALFVVMRVLATYRKAGWSGIKKNISEVNIYVGAGLFSIIIWGIMPKTQAYGLSYWIALVFITMLKLYGEDWDDWKNRGIYKVYYCASFAIPIFLLALNYSFMNSYIGVSSQREQIITEAVDTNKNEVIVPVYPSQCESVRISTDYLNNQDFYNNDYTREYYGVHIILKGN